MSFSAIDFGMRTHFRGTQRDASGRNRHAGADASSCSESVTPPAYRPSFDDLMTLAVQPRHIKLGLAGQEANWTAVEIAQRQEGNPMPAVRASEQKPRHADTSDPAEANFALKRPAVQKNVLSARRAP